MSAAPLQIAARYAGRWAAIVFFVVLLTLIFSFLGTIICAVLAGMMFGATKHVRWQALLISLIFPSAIFGLLRAGRAPLHEQQVALLSFLCFGAFWLTYAVAAAVIYYERSAPLVAPSQSPRPPAVARNGKAVAVQSAASHRFTLDDLQGTWSAPVSGTNGQAVAKELEIKSRELVLCVRDANGRLCTLGRAELNFQNPRQLALSANGFDDTLICI